MFIFVYIDDTFNNFNDQINALTVAMNIHEWIIVKRNKNDPSKYIVGCR